jgi:hypothetical protein
MGYSYIYSSFNDAYRHTQQCRHLSFVKEEWRVRDSNWMDVASNKYRRYWASSRRSDVYKQQLDGRGIQQVQTLLSFVDEEWRVQTATGRTWRPASTDATELRRWGVTCTRQQLDGRGIQQVQTLLSFVEEEWRVHDSNWMDVASNKYRRYWASSRRSDVYTTATGWTPAASTDASWQKATKLMSTITDMWRICPC